MKIKERVNFIDQKLQELYPSPAIPLDHQDPYTLLIAVLLSAQCTDARVNKITPTLFQLASTPDKMTKQSVEKINDIVRPCGLAPRKANAIHTLSQILLDEHQGMVPESLEALEKLLAQRWKLSNGKSVTQTEKDLKRHFPKNRWNKLHLQIIYFAREHCPAHACHGLACIICKTCFPTRVGKVMHRKA